MAAQVAITLTTINSHSLLALEQEAQVLNRRSSLEGRVREQVLAIVGGPVQPLAASQPPQVQGDKRGQRWPSPALPPSSLWSTLRGKP